MTIYVKLCPACQSARPLHEVLCTSEIPGGERCQFVLMDVLATPQLPNGLSENAQEPYESGPSASDSDPVNTADKLKDQPGVDDRTADEPVGLEGRPTCCSCRQPLEPDDSVCLACGTPVDAGLARTAPERSVADWTIVADLPSPSAVAALFLARRAGDPTICALRHFQSGMEPDVGIYPILEKLDHPSVPRLLAHGRFEQRAYEVWENVEGPTLAEIAPALADEPTGIESVANGLIAALALFERRGLRHGSLVPAVIRRRSSSQLVLCVTDFATASVAEFDIEASRLLRPNRYMAPEAIADASTSASDWWSLGIILLELLTKGECFEGVHERAYLLHLVARGIALPERLTPRWRNLLEGLLTRNHEDRWKADEALRWAAGEADIPTKPDGARHPVVEGSEFVFAGQKFRSPAELAFAAADDANWAESLADLEHGRISHWLSGFDKKLKKGESYDLVSKISSDQRIPADLRLALALAAMSRDLPLCIRGALVTPTSLLANPDQSGKWLSAPVLAVLRKLKRDRDQWLVQLAERADRVRARAHDARLDMDENQFAVLRLVTSTAALEARWAKMRSIFPDSTNATVASLIERRTPSDEDLLLLASLQHGHFRMLEEVLRDAETLGKQVDVPEFDRTAATALLAGPRRTMIDELNTRVPGFERCQRPKINEWIDSFRSANRRISLTRLLVTLAIPVDEWQEPPEQEYIKNVLGHMRRRVLAGIQQGSLIQMRATASILDLTVLNPPQLLETLLDQLVTRSDAETRLGSRSTISTTFFDNVRALDNKARTFQRDTGMEALVVGFPVLTLLDRTSEGDRTRIAPLLLWPVKLTVANGATGTITLASDPGRDVAINPALETILGTASFELWSERISTVIDDGFDSRSSVLSALADLVEGDISDQLCPIPKATTIRSPNKPAIRPSAALFLAEFPSQAIANDLKQLQQKSLDGTALQCLLRLSQTKAPQAPPVVPHIERFATLEADPSQEDAVLRSRFEPGLVVQGPPGTGKSQTIVNIITDCIGRGESVLVVCEKKAALDVVQKRLAAEQLAERVIRVESTATDRTTVLNGLRTQVPRVTGDAVNHAAGARQKRLPVAAKMDALEAGLDAYHEAVHANHQRLQMSHREVLALIAAQKTKTAGLSAPGLRRALGGLTASELEAVITACMGLVEIWLSGGIPGHSLACLKPKGVDQSQADSLATALTDFFQADAARIASLQKHSQQLEHYLNLQCTDANALSVWLRTNATAFRALAIEDLRHCATWQPYFSSRSQLSGAATDAKTTLAVIIGELDALAVSGPARLVHPAITIWPDADVAMLAEALSMLRSAPSFFDRLNLWAALRRRSVAKVLSVHGVGTDPASAKAYAEAAVYEQSLRSLAKRLIDVSGLLAQQPALRAASRSELLHSARTLLDDVAQFERFASRLDACPAADIWHHVVAATDPTNTLNTTQPPLVPLIAALESVLDLAKTRTHAKELLDGLIPFLTEPVAAQLTTDLNNDSESMLDRAAIIKALPHLVAFQTFRLRHAELPEAARTVFAVLTPLAGALNADDATPPQERIEALIRLEAASAWKELFETERPVLRQIHGEIEARIAELDALDQTMRGANRRWLAAVDRDQIAAPTDWSTIWALGGTNQKRLRQIFERGRQLGLLKLRPVWLVNPDVASRMLPLEAGLFDVVIFDEASQMRVVNALPALYRAKRCVISGDEKQLPPTTFFGSRNERSNDDNGDAVDPSLGLDSELDPTQDEDAEASTPRFDPQLLRASERHIKDCEDLLALARGLLPEASLDIHYRSEYRELIAFSNAAYYGGRLNVPLRKSTEEVRRARPIEVRRIDGLYSNQTNPQEADAVVALLCELWTSNANPPTVGVVTFNMKQAELISARLDAKADQDRTFSNALLRERTRKTQGEDVGFFVKNLENVQGDERDWIVFSTTFGRDENDVFKRSFGALNQQGGERRLNVAVTRAKQKVVVVTSMPIAEISSFLGKGRAPTMARDYLQSYMRYAELIDQSEFRSAASILNAFEGTAQLEDRATEVEPDELVKQALATLHSEGFAAELMPPEDAFSLDIAVSEPTGARYVLGVEIDSPRHPLLRHARAREVWRPKLLARSGLSLHRIASAEWVRNPEGERSRLIMAARTAVNGAEA